MINQIHISFIPHERQRYDTCGDYWIEGDVLEVRISQTGMTIYDRMVMIHELAEWVITEWKGISTGLIDAFDFSYKGDGEPGDELECPYRDAHCIATGIERMLCGALGIPWQKYEATIDGLSKDAKP